MRAITVRVAARPDASREKVAVLGEHEYRIAVREPAQGGAANARIRTLLALRYQVPELRVRMRTGARSPRKSYDVILES